MELTEGIPRLLQEIREQLIVQKQDFLDIKEQITSSINENINKKFSGIIDKYTELEEKIHNQQRHINYLEKYIKRKNLIFFGIEEEEGTYQDLKEKIINLVKSKMNANIDNSTL